MTQKELLYIDDTLGHITYLKTLLNFAIEQMSDDELANFLSDVLSAITKEEKCFKKLIDG